MKKETVTINLENGLEATPAAMLVQVASRYSSTVYIQSEDGSVRVNAKSIMGMMSLGLNAGECVVVEANGADEKEAVDNIEKYLTGKAAS
ncbi:MAG: HPr family phosphocarrier protein [Lachnospiraceae bacterium]|nr:HPr family phosphocarrier protein [Lachnospiraceae bacterium]